MYMANTINKFTIQSYLMFTKFYFVSTICLAQTYLQLTGGSVDYLTGLVSKTHLWFGIFGVDPNFHTSVV